MFLYILKNEHITAVRLASLLSSIHSAIDTSIYPSSLCLDTSPSSSRMIPRHSRDSRVMQSLQRVLVLTRGLLSAGHAWDTSPGRLPGGIWYRCLSPLSWLLRLYSEHLPGERASHPISKGAPLQPGGKLNWRLKRELCLVAQLLLSISRSILPSYMNKTPKLLQTGENLQTFLYTFSLRRTWRSPALWPLRWNPFIHDCVWTFAAWLPGPVDA